MADNFEHHGPDAPGDVAPGEDDITGGFPDHPSGSAPSSLNPSGAGFANPAPGGDPANKIGPPSSYKAPRVPLDDDDDVVRRRRPLFPVLLGAALAAVLVAAWVIGKRQAASPPAVAAAPPPPAAAAPGGAETPAAAAAAAEAKAADSSAETTRNVATLEARVKDLASQVDDLADRLMTVEGTLHDLPKPEPPPDIKPVQSKLDALSKSVAVVAPLTKKVETVDGRLDDLDNHLKSVKDEVASLKDELKKAAANPTTASKPADEPKPSDDDATTALNGGADLFKAGKYKEAGEVFKKLAADSPKDARVYYYEALANGLTTNKWDGDTLTIAAKGAALEKAGSPKSSEIDSTFADLPDKLKPWLAFFRKQAK